MTGTRPTWRKSSYSSDQGNCVELAETGESVLVRNSRHPGRGVVAVASLAAFVADCKAGALDDLTGD